MAVYNLHYVLFTVTKLATTHLLLDESHKLVWTSPHQVQPTNQTCHPSRRIFKQLTEEFREEPSKLSRFLYDHLLIFTASLVAFVASFKSLKRTDERGNHRQHFLRFLKASIAIHALYLYSTNSLANSQPWESPLTLRCAHTIVLLLLIVGFQWTHSVIGSIGDSLTVKFCLRYRESVGVHYQFITNLMVSALGVAVASVTICELFMAKFSIQVLSFDYTNAVVIAGLVSVGVELICMQTFTVSGESSVLEKGATKSESCAKQKAGRGSRVGLDSDDESGDKGRKAVYSLTDCPARLSKNILSLSLANQRQSNSGEILYATEDEEYDGSTVELFRMYSELRRYPFKSHPQVPTVTENKLDSYDRNKFSLYEGFGMKTCVVNMKKSQISHRNGASGQQDKRSLSAFEFLISDSDSKFVQQAAMLILIGSIYQANQLCFFSDYLHYLAHDSPPKFRVCLLASMRNHSYHRLNLAHLACLVWIELVCASFLIQSTAKVVCLHYVNSLVFKLGTRMTLLITSLFTLTVPIFFALNYNLVEWPYSNISTQMRVTLVLLQLVFIQFQIGLIGSVMEFLINDLALQFSQQVASQQKSETSKSSKQSSHCQVHGLLSGSFNLLGAALMSAASLIYRFLLDTHRYETTLYIALAIISSLPGLLLLSLGPALWIKRIELRKLRNPLN